MNREELIDVITKEIEKLNTLPNIKEENFNMGYKKAIYDSCYLYENMNQEIERLNNNWNELEKFICDLEIECNIDSSMWGVAVIIHNKLKELKGVDKE